MGFFEASMSGLLDLNWLTIFFFLKWNLMEDPTIAGIRSNEKQRKKF